MNLIENQVLSPRLNGVSLHVSQSRSGTRAHNINTVKCKLCNNMVSSSSFNSHLVKCHNASPELIKKMSVKTGPVNPPSPPRQPYTTVNLVAGQTVYQSGAKMKFHAYIPEKENSHGITSLVLKSQNGNSPKSNNSSSKGSDSPSNSPKSQKSATAPPYDIQLNEVVKPTTLDQMIGQESAVNQMKQVQTEFNQGNFYSVFITGPLGSGKSTLAAILKRFIQTNTDAHFLDIGSDDGKNSYKKICSNSKPVFLLLDNIHLLKSEQEETLIEILTKAPNLFLIATITDLNNSPLQNCLSKKVQVSLDKLTNKYICQILENARTYLKSNLNLIGCDKLEIGDTKLDEIVSLCNGSASIALSNLYTQIPLSENNSSVMNNPKADTNSKVGNRVLASLVTSVVDMPNNLSSLSSTLSELKTALNIKTRDNTPHNVTKPLNKNLGKRNNKVECSTAIPDAKRFFPTTFQSPQQLNTNHPKMSMPPIKQEINGDLLKMCPAKYITIAGNGAMQGFTNSIPTPIFLASPPVTAMPLDNAAFDQKTAVYNDNAKVVDSTDTLSIGGNTVQFDQISLTYNLHISMLIGNEDLALLVLSSLLQNGVKPLIIAQELLSFASLYIGLTDPTALQTALLVYQTCQSLPSTHTTLILTQLVMQLTKSNKSTEIRDKCIQMQQQQPRTQS